LTARNSSHLKVRNSDVGNSEVGVSGFDKSEVITSSTRITSAAKGLVANDSSVMTLVEAEITNCDINSLLVRKTAKVNVLSSSFTNNGAPGIVLKDFSRLKMEDSQVSNNEEGGVLLADSAIAKLIDNRITYNGKKNVAIISKKCGFSGPSNLFFGEVDGAGNDIKPKNSDTVCPEKFSRITSSTGGSYSYPFKPSTYAFIGLVGIASLYFLLSG
jgi:parallel beta-helix repeat protein